MQFFQYATLDSAFVPAQVVSLRRKIGFRGIVHEELFYP